MKRALLIAEKPSLMRDLESAYKSSLATMPYNIDFVALRGHFVELSSPEEYGADWGTPWRTSALPMIPDKFKTRVKDGVKSDYNRIANQLKNGGYDVVINGCDAGREGQLIFGLVYDKAGCKLPVKRVWAQDTTTESLVKALENLLDGDEPHLDRMTKASYYRSYFDWLIGMNLTRAATLKTTKAIPVGRVMTPTLNIVVQRDLEIANFVPRKYYEVEADFGGYKGSWFDPKTNENSFEDEKRAKALISKLGKNGTVESVDTKRVSTEAPALHSLAVLQQDANKTFGFTANQTLDIAQSLYETHKLLSYPRTESQALSSALGKDITGHIKAISGIPEVSKFVASIDSKTIDKTMKSKKYVDDAKVTDHHAIIPTKRVPDFSKLNSNETKLYMLVVRRFVSIFLPPYITNKTTVVTSVEATAGAKELFKTVGSVLVSMGWKDVYSATKTDAPIPAVKKGDSVSVKGFALNEKETTPPSPYNDASLIEAMMSAGKFVEDDEFKAVLKETTGIGTSATRANIIEKLLTKNMLYRKGKQIRAAEFGFKVIEILNERAITSPALTAEWETKLRSIEDGTLDHKKFHSEMIDYVKEETASFLSDINTKLSAASIAQVVGVCPICGTDVIAAKNYYMCKKYCSEKSADYATKTDPCKFIFPKVFLGKTLSATDVKNILSGKQTSKLKLKSKDGKRFEARLIFDKSKGQVTFVNNSESSESPVSKAGSTIGKCPCCGKPVKDQGRLGQCEGCEFKIYYTLCKVNLTLEEIKSLLGGETIGPKKFTWSSGKTGIASLKLENGKPSFKFENKKKD